MGADERLNLIYAVLLLWLQLPIGAVQVAYDYLVPLLENHAPLLFSPQTVNKKQKNTKGNVYNRANSTSSTSSGSLESEKEARVAQLGTMLRLLSMSGVLSVERADTIREVKIPSHREFLLSFKRILLFVYDTSHYAFFHLYSFSPLKISLFFCFFKMLFILSLSFCFVCLFFSPRFFQRVGCC